MIIEKLTNILIPGNIVQNYGYSTVENVVSNMVNNRTLTSGITEYKEQLQEFINGIVARYSIQDGCNNESLRTKIRTFEQKSTVGLSELAVFIGTFIITNYFEQKPYYKEYNIIYHYSKDKIILTSSDDIAFPGLRKSNDSKDAYNFSISLSSVTPEVIKAQWKIYLTNNFNLIVRESHRATLGFFPNTMNNSYQLLDIDFLKQTLVLRDGLDELSMCEPKILSMATLLKNLNSCLSTIIQDSKYIAIEDPFDKNKVSIMLV